MMYHFAMKSYSVLATCELVYIAHNADSVFSIATNRAWRQKIEAWLTENEKEEKQNEELKRRARRVQSNRRSLEADSGEQINWS